MLKYIPVKKPSGVKLLNELLKKVLKRNPKGGSLCKLSLNLKYATGQSSDKKEYV